MTVLQTSYDPALHAEIRLKAAPASLDEFVAGATEHQGSWWPDWAKWIGALAEKKVPVKGARIPGKGKLKAIDDAPGSYVRAR